MTFWNTKESKNVCFFFKGDEGFENEIVSFVKGIRNVAVAR